MLLVPQSEMPFGVFKTWLLKLEDDASAMGDGLVVSTVFSHFVLVRLGM